MIEKEMGPGDIKRKVLDLATAMNDVRISQADRDDEITEMKHAKLSRLELLVNDLQPVIDDLPKDCDQFELLLSKGEAPRLWVDMASFIRLAGDGREYEFVKDTRMGRAVFARAEEREVIGQHVTKYIAERVLQRERMIEGDCMSVSKIAQSKTEADCHKGQEIQTQKVQTQKPEKIENPKEPEVSTSRPKKINVAAKLKDNMDKSDTPVRASKLWYGVWFLLGLIGGGIILFGLMWLGLMDKIIALAH